MLQKLQWYFGVGGGGYLPPPYTPYKGGSSGKLVSSNKINDLALTT